MKIISKMTFIKIALIFIVSPNVLAAGVWTEFKTISGYQLKATNGSFFIFTDDSWGIPGDVCVDQVVIDVIEPLANVNVAANSNFNQLFLSVQNAAEQGRSVRFYGECGANSVFTATHIQVFYGD